ncbi:Arabidopsis thaliana ASYNAPTIC 3, ASYNAPTIC 3 [Hibiscus trionum]|uniref:Arabidopsis thaliana ASYNAPTIC 3, ASYNAPTIC 3 n=1 Tax=Hibiscus trionum TaxID=183268 RepID=A0A9W7MLF8_HIBTR|nr:Arabidopsis thaliana ASYNAPTIC 3, ASYNAPTIC 3 [Hibiscus trionum]
MKVDARQSLREDRMSDCRSFGSNFHPSSQSRKISIGVLVDSLAKRKPGGTEGHQNKQANAERIKPSVGISTEGQDKGDADRTSKGNQTEDNEQVKSPWITPRSLHRETLAPETASLPKEASNPRQKKLHAVEDVPETNSVPFKLNQNFNANNVGSEQNNFDDLINGLSYKRKGWKDGNSQRVDEFNYANQWKDKVELEHKAGKTENIQTETLKKKLHELFTTVSSPKSLQSSLQSHKVSANNLKQERSADHVGDTAVNPRQNSVNVEIVSDNPDKTVKRPATCSLIRKRAPAKVQLANTKISLSSKQKHGDSISSLKGRPSSLQSHKVSANNLKQESSADHVGDTAVNPRQNSVNVEIVSDDPDKTVKRPATCSLIQKRAPAKMQLPNTKIGLSSKQKHGDSIFSPKSLQSSLQSHKVSAINLKQERSADHVGDTSVNPRQNSVNVEIVSDNPDKTVKRPATRSLIRKRAPAKIQLANTKIGLSYKQKHGDSIFSFGEGRSAKLDGAVNTGSLFPRQKKNEKKSSKIYPHQICSPEEDNADEIEILPDSSSEKGEENFEKVQEKDSFHSPMPNEMYLQGNFDNPTSSRKWDKQEDDGNISLRNFVHTKDDYQSSKIDPHQICSPEEDNAGEIESLPDYSSEKGGENFEKVQEKNSFHSPMPNETNQQGNFDNPTSPRKWDKNKQGDDGNISLRNFVHTQDDYQSPTFRFNMPTLNTSSSPTPKTVEIERGTCSPVPFERGFAIRNIGSFRTFQTSGPASNKSNAEAESSEDTEKHTASLRNQMSGNEKFDSVNQHSESSPASKDQFSETFKGGSPIINRYDCHRENLISPETVISEKTNFDHCPIKRFRNEDVKLSEFSPTSPSPKEGAGTGESYWFQKPLEQDQEDELTRAITLLALALETFKCKMDSATRKKSSEILMSISEEMKSMLLNAESQIESDVGKLTNLSKTKRKRLETRLQEQQEQLKLILKKFKEDIHHHLLDCNSILERMEAHQNELKGIMKKQKVSHNKLLMHVEETAEIQLNNAERRITAVHESAREKMLQLKHVIVECLTGIY